ncbi:LMBR1 domain-containing protein 2 homolog [Agrilus planipennis]|uniref:LMBR1 domain-containing protein 2 homolog n=1 Tax=Agrilus planipennis TaxID=224129 RepID=A0A1W4WIQ6_AGRPL|nr:LMBR1 domain-containing protein 2 homolog [Agrilus planipennis]
MSYTPIIFNIVLSFVLSSTTLYRYGNWFRHHVIVTLAVLLAWYFSFLIIFILPLDVISTVFRQCLEENVSFELNSSVNASTICEEPWSHVPEKVFPNLWRTVYWSSQFLTWLIMPMMQSYSKAGDFTIKGKLKSALIDNAIYYGSYLFICGILLIYLALKPGINLDWQKLKAIASSASNTWGLFLLVLLLGYAFVEVPRSLWNNGNLIYVLNHSYFKVAKLSSDKCEAEETVDDVLESLQAITIAVKPGHTLYQHVETIMQKVPVELKEKMNRRELPDDTPVDAPSEKSLIRLHKQVIKSLQILQRTETRWSILVEKVFELEDIAKNLTSRERRFKRMFPKKKNPMTRFFYGSKLEWYWKCILQNYTTRVLALLAATLSVAIVWSEVTFFNKQPVLSIFAVIVNVAKKNYDYFTIEVLSRVVILYFCYCAYSTVLKIRLLNLYYLAPYHQTNEYSLIFSGMMLCRLTPPLCLNFLGLIHMDSHIIKKQVLETHYTQVMGHMDVIGIISDGFNVYFPMAILAFCLSTYISIGSRVLSLCGFHQFVGDDEITSDLVDEGREIMKREKRKRQRAQESFVRRREMQDRFHNLSRYRGQNANEMEREMQETRSSTSNLMRDAVALESYDGTKFNTDEIDTSFLPENDIDSRFGISTHRNLADAGNRRVGPPPRGIFDDV